MIRLITYEALILLRQAWVIIQASPIKLKVFKLPAENKVVSAPRVLTCEFARTSVTFDKNRCRLSMERQCVLGSIL